MSCFWNRFARHSAIMRDAARAEMALMARLVDALPRTFHVYAMALDHWLEAEPLINARTVAARLLTTQLRDLLQAVWCGVPTSVLSVLNRCGQTVQPPEFYIHLHHCMSDARMAPLVRRGTSPVTTEALNRVGDRVCLDPALDEIRMPMNDASLGGLNWLVMRLRDLRGSDLREAWLRGILRNLTQRTRKHQLRELLKAFPRVAAPWPGNDQLLPVETVDELISLGLEMGNCLAAPRYAVGLIQGADAFYRVGSEIAVRISKSDHGRWSIAEMQGTARCVLRIETREAISRAMTQAGIILPDDDHHARNLHHLMDFY